MRNRALAFTRDAKRRLSTHRLAQQFFDSVTGLRLREFIYRTNVEHVLPIADALDRSGVRWWLAGGWGIDALVGRQTRAHADLDVCIDMADEGEVRAQHALLPLGYEVSNARALSGGAFPVRSVLRDHSGRTLDLLPVSADRADRTGLAVPADQHRPGELGDSMPILGAESFALGTIAGREVPCISAQLQLRAHCGYAPQPKDRADVQTVCEHSQLPLPAHYARLNDSPTPAPSLLRRIASESLTRIRGASALILYVPEVDHIVDAVIAGHRSGLTAHLTILYPFMAPRRISSGTVADLRRIAGTIESSDLELARMDTFGTNAYLAVEPEAPIVALTQACWDQWPAYPPYGGAYEEIVPHVLIAHDVLPEDIASTVEPRLPVASRAQELTLVTYGMTGRWRVKQTFPLAAPRADPVAAADASHTR